MRVTLSFSKTLSRPECSDRTSPLMMASLPSDQVQRGTAVTPARLSFRKKSAATPLLARGTWQSLCMPKIKPKGGERGGGGGGETEIEV